MDPGTSFARFTMRSRMSCGLGIAVVRPSAPAPAFVPALVSAAAVIPSLLYKRMPSSVLTSNAPGLPSRSSFPLTMTFGKVGQSGEEE